MDRTLILAESSYSKEWRGIKFNDVEPKFKLRILSGGGGPQGQTHKKNSFAGFLVLTFQGVGE